MYLKTLTKYTVYCLCVCALVQAAFVWMQLCLTVCMYARLKQSNCTSRSPTIRSFSADYNRNIFILSCSSTFKHSRYILHAKYIWGFFSFIQIYIYTTFVCVCMYDRYTLDVCIWTFIFIFVYHLSNCIWVMWVFSAKLMLYDWKLTRWNKYTHNTNYTK